MSTDLATVQVKNSASPSDERFKRSIGNHGVSTPDIRAIGEDRVTKLDWLRAHDIDLAARARIVKLSHMRYQHPDLNIVSQFLQDFGLHVVEATASEMWFAGYGPDQYVYYARQGPKEYLGGCFEVETREDLEKILRIPHVKVLSDGIEEMTNAPGGGYLITVADPEDFPVSFLFGQSAKMQTYEVPVPLVVNYESNKQRQRHFQRFEPGPAEVFKLGHFGLVVENFSVSMDWYVRHFNLVPSDILYLPLVGSDQSAAAAGTVNRKEIAMFAHIDRGEDLVDHHTLLLSGAKPGKRKHVHHCSFEVHDFDTQALGHQWLAKKQYKSVWGIGRHILGSQIFDYWWDPTGNMIEHYADGDLVCMETPMAYGPAGHEGLAIWGPEVPQTFLD